MKTITLYKIFHSELIKQGLNEFVNDENELVYFDDDYQMMKKILSFDDDMLKLVNQLFLDHQLADPENDYHFKKTFFYRFINKQINKQTIEGFQMELVNVFLTNENYINTIYNELDKYIVGQTENEQNTKSQSDSENISDNRQAYADLPQNMVNIDVDDTEMVSASDNTISRNKQRAENHNESENTNLTKSYQLDQLIKTNGIMEEIFLKFDQKCFLQVW